MTHAVLYSIRLRAQDHLFHEDEREIEHTWNHKPGALRHEPHCCQHKSRESPTTIDNPHPAPGENLFSINLVLSSHRLAQSHSRQDKPAQGEGAQRTTTTVLGPFK
jgi:hypothetical protein